MVIYEKGCLRAGEEWVERNLVPVAGVAVAMAVLQVKTGLLSPRSKSKFVLHGVSFNG